MESLLVWLSHYGYAGLFALLMLGIVGLPIPDETLLVFSGYLISTGRLKPGAAFVAGLAGSGCGISLSYFIGRTLGREAVKRYGPYIHLTEARLDMVHGWFLRVGEWLLAIGYFIPGVRHFTALVAGTSRLEFRTFALFAYAGAGVWVATFLSIGYLVGENWRTVVALIQRYTVSAVVLAVVVAMFVWWWQKQRVY